MAQNPGSEKHGILDPWKITLIHLVYTICGSMLSERFFSGLLTGTAPLDTFIQMIEKLWDLPNRGDEVAISLRGLKTGRHTSPEQDYQIATGELRIDLQEAIAIGRRQGSSMMHLQGQLLKAWEVFKNYGITSVVVRLLEPTSENLNLLRSSMNFLSRYYQAVERHQSLSLTLDGERKEVPILYDKENQPNPNLTLLAYLNDLRKDDVAMLIWEAEQLAKQKETDATELQQSWRPEDVLDLMAEVKQGLEISPIKINTISLVAIKEEEVVVPKDRLDLDGAIKRIYGSDQEKARSMISDLYGDGLDVHQAEEFGRGLQQISEFLSKLADLGTYKEVEQEVIAKFSKEIRKVSKEVLRRMNVGSDILKIVQPDQSVLELQVDHKLLSILKPIKQKVDVYDKLRNIHDKETTFTRIELKMLAKDFRTPVDEVDMFLKAVQHSFDGAGNFNRDLFDEQAKILAIYGEQAFPLLLYYLKNTENKKARISLLNSLPTLFEIVERPRKAVGSLLREFCTPFDKIHHFDRNLLMLATKLLRHYRKEKGVDIEMTPEEVLLVQKGLIEDAIRLAHGVIVDLQKEIRLKNLAMRNALIDSLAKRDHKRPGDFAPRFLFSLQRELYILLALIGGPIAKRILRDSSITSSNPISRIYNQPASKKYLSNILRLFKTIVRSYVRLLRPIEVMGGYGRLLPATEKDRQCLETLRNNIPALASKTSEESHHSVLRQVDGYINRHLTAQT